MSASTPYVHWFEEVGHHDVIKVGGKNASLGEMVANLGRRPQSLGEWDRVEVRTPRGGMSASSATSLSK